MKLHWLAISVLTVGVFGLFLIATDFGGSHQSIALLERLAPRIERTAALTPEARDTIERLVERVRNDPLNPHLESRRERVIERVATALRDKDASQELSSVGRRSD